MHGGTVGVEDAHHARVRIELADVVCAERFRATFAFVVAGTDADGVDVAPILFLLRMDERIAVYLACGTV